MSTPAEAAATLRGVALGTELGRSSPLPITQEMISDFARVTGDHQWIHVDEDRASTGPYGVTVAHGYLVLSLLPRLTRDVVDFASGGTVINYGLNRVRFLSAVRSDARILDSITLQGRTEKPTGTLYELAHELTDEASGELVCIAHTATLVLGVP